MKNSVGVRVAIAIGVMALTMGRPLSAMDFVRSDCNADGATNLADAITVLSHLFDSASIPCDDACDTNDDGAVDIADAIAALSYLFSFGAAPSAPFPDCGVDPTGDTITCDSFDVCGVAPLSHAVDIQPIWEANCAGMCHEPGGVGVLFVGLDLSGDAFDDIVGVIATQAPLPRVTPGDPDASYLWHKLNGTQMSVGGTGQTMPVGAPLDPAALALIQTWIEQGANP